MFVWLQTLEVDNAWERCRLLESQNKVKLVEPQNSQIPQKFPKKWVKIETISKVKESVYFGFPEGGALALNHVGILYITYDF